MKAQIAVAMAVVSLVSAGRAHAEESPPVAGKTVLGVAWAQLDALAVGYRASTLIGASVYNDKDERIGKVGDIIVTPDGTVSLAIVDVGGFLGLGKHHVAIPVGQFSAVKPRVVLPGATQEALEQLPPFEYAVDSQLHREAAALKAELEQLKAQRAQAAGEDKAKLDAKIAAVKADVRATQGRVEAALAAEKKDSAAKLDALNVKVAKAGADARAKWDLRIANTRVEHERRSKLLHEAWELTKQALAG